MNVRTPTHWKRHLRTGLLACLIYPTVSMGFNTQSICFSGNNCLGQKIPGYTSCATCPGTLNTPCKSCCVFRSGERVIQSIQPCLPPIGKQFRSR